MSSRNTINNPPTPQEKIKQINRVLSAFTLSELKDLLALILRYFPLDIQAGSGVTISKDLVSGVYIINSTGGGGINLETNGVPNVNQTLLNLIAGDYISLTSDNFGGVTIDVDGILSSEIVSYGVYDPPINLLNQSDNHATQINMGFWDGITPFSIVYYTKINPKDGAILEIEISDTFAITSIPAGPGVVNLEVIYGVTTIFNQLVSADRAIRFRYDSLADVWFPISYVTVVAPPGGVYTVNNGLTQNPANNFQLGGSLIQNTTITSSGFTLSLLSNVNFPNIAYSVINSGTGTAIYAQASAGSAALSGFNQNGPAVVGRTNAGYGADFSANGAGFPLRVSKSTSATNNLEFICQFIRETSGTAVNGIGGYLDFAVQTSTGIIWTTHRLNSKWTNAVTASRTSQFEIEGVNNAVLARLLALTGPGQLILDKYGVNTFASTPAYALGVDASGNVIEFTPATGGGSVTSVATAGLISGGPITTSGTITTSMNTNKLVGRGTAGTGIMEEITLGTGLSLSGTTLNATGGGGGILHGTALGTDTYTVTITGVTAYNDGDAYLIRFTNGNTTTSTLNINGLGAIALFRNNDGQVIGGDIWAGAEMLCVYNSTANNFQVIGTSPNSLYAYVTNEESITITKGQAVYAFGGTGDRMTVKLAFNTSDATSAQTVGLVYSTSIAANQKGFIIIQGLLDNLSILPTSTWSDGDPVYLGATAGAITKVKPYAPNHLVYLGIVTTASNGNAGRMYVRVQNGYELDELHNVQARTPALKDTLWYDNTVSPAQWKTASIATILGYTPLSQTLANTNIFVGNASNIATAVAMSGDATIANTGALTIANNLKTGSFGVTVDGIIGIVQVGTTGYVVMPYDGTITSWVLTANASGTVSFDITKASSGVIPTVSIIGGGGIYPTLSSQQIATGLTLTGWTTTFSAGDVFGFSVRSSPAPATIKNVTLTIRVTRS